MTKRKPNILITGILFLLMILNVWAQKPHNASKALEINNLRLISTFRTLDEFAEHQIRQWTGG